jgi:hypothetical protein
MMPGAAPTGLAGPLRGMAVPAGEVSVIPRAADALAGQLLEAFGDIDGRAAPPEAA